MQAPTQHKTPSRRLQRQTRHVGNSSQPTQTHKIHKTLKQTHKTIQTLPGPIFVPAQNQNDKFSKRRHHNLPPPAQRPSSQAPAQRQENNS